MKLRAMLPSNFSSQITLGNFQNLGLIRILDHTLNVNPNNPEKYLIIIKCEIVDSAVEMKIKNEDKKVESKQEVVAKSAAQILHVQHGNMAPSGRMGMNRRVYPLVSSNPYQGNWTIKVRVTSKGNLRTYRNARGEGQVFNVELTDQDGTQIQATMFNEAAKKFYNVFELGKGTQIQATMFNEAAKKFYNVFELGKVYYISRGTLKVANKQFKTVQNDYEMTLTENSVVEEVTGEGTFIPETKFNFVPIDQLGSYVNGRELVDIIGVVQNVSPTLSIRRKLDNESIPKRDITIADESKKTVVVSLWNDLATNVGQELLDAVDTAPIVALKSLKVGDFQGVSLSSLGKSHVIINPDLPEAKKLRSWYNSEGKGVSMDSVGSGVVSNASRNGARSMYSDRVFVSHITSNPSLGEDKY